MFDLDTVTQQLSEHQFKITRQRRAVLDAIAASHTRLSPADVYAKARRGCRDLGLATVYRTLDILAELGAIRRVHLDDGCEGFAPAAMPHGHHVICVKCNRVMEFEGCDISTVIRSAAKETGFHIEEHWLELMGTCKECRKQGRLPDTASGHG